MVHLAYKVAREKNAHTHQIHHFNDFGKTCFSFCDDIHIARSALMRDEMR